MPDRNYDIVIVGAGIIGTSIAYHLAKRGGVRVAVVEKEINPGMGSTSKAAGGIRAQFASDINIELSRLSIAAFETFPREMEIEVDFHQVGYLWLAGRPEDMDLFRRNVERQRTHGLDVRTLTPEEIGTLAPYVKLDGLVGGTFHDKDGYAPPADYVMGYHKQAKKRGVEFLLADEVTGFEGTTVLTKKGSLGAVKVVWTVGAWTEQLGKMLGIEIPIRPIRRQCFVTEPISEGLAHPVPMTVDFSTGIYMHSESGGLLVGKADKNEPPSYHEHADYPFVEHMAELAMARVPLLEEATIRTSWGGLYGVTPDHHPILGELPGHPGFYIAAGFSGHGFMHAPATGQVMSEIMIDGTSKTLDISCLRFSRFKENDLIQETHVI